MCFFFFFCQYADGDVEGKTARGLDDVDALLGAIKWECLSWCFLQI